VRDGSKTIHPAYAVLRFSPILDEVGIGFVPASPLGRGFLTGTARPGSKDSPGDIRFLRSALAAGQLRAELRGHQPVRCIRRDQGRDRRSASPRSRV
jgi:aryl-alcohol dehydrogenase-like predicted oxidoreductase